jgi:hypothetical protein
MNIIHHIFIVNIRAIAVFDLQGNILKGTLNSRTATRLVREWIDLHSIELEEDWNLAMKGKEIKKIAPLN